MDGVSGRRVHRFRGVEEKRRIVEETLRDGVSVSSVARVHGVNANQVFRWRRLYRDGLLDSGAGEMRLLPVAVSDEAQAERLSASLDDPEETRPSSGAIELMFAWGLLRIIGAVDAGMLRTVLGCLLT